MFTANQKYWRNVAAIIVVVLGWLSLPTLLRAQNNRISTSATKQTTFPLRGQAAVKHLKQQGLYDSLREAMAAAITPPMSVPTLTEQTKLTVSEGKPDEQFGVSLAISGDTVVVGARQVHDPDRGLIRLGAAYIFKRMGDSWIRLQTLTASDRNEGDLFGSDVDIDAAGTIVVGATFARGPRPTVHQGAAYVFQSIPLGSPWTQTAKLDAGLDGQEGDQFGGDVAINGTLVVVGARLHKHPAKKQGAAYVFKLPIPGPPQELTVMGDDTATFGASVATNGTTVVVGAPGETGNRGAAYVSFGCSVTCTVPGMIPTPPVLGSAMFGQSVAISGSTIVVGAPTETIGVNSEQGAAYVFSLSSAFPTQKLVAGGGKAFDLFGGSVAISGGGTVVVGANLDDDNGEDSGAAYIFDPAGIPPMWIEKQKLKACELREKDEFGNSVAISGATVVVGALRDNSNKGAAYVFDSDDRVCLTDDRTGDVLRVNLTTGAYKYTRCHSSFDLFFPPGDRFECVYNVGNPFQLGFNCDQMTGTFHVSSVCRGCCTYTLTEYTPLGNPIVIASITRCLFFPDVVTVTGNAKTMFSPRFGTGFSILDTRDESTCCCPANLPDLVPERRTGADGTPVPGPDGFCRRDPVTGNLIVRVRNLGSGRAGSLLTQVVFEPGGMFTMPTPEIPAGGFVDVTFPIPPACFDRDCDFTITVNAGVPGVTESNKANNTVRGICIG